MRQAQFVITPEIKGIVVRELEKDEAAKFLKELQTGFARLCTLYDYRTQDTPFETLNAQLLKIRDASKALAEAIISSDPNTESLIRQGQYLRGDTPSANNLHTDLVGYLEDIYLGIDEISEDLKPAANRPKAWQEREVIKLLITCWVESRGNVPKKTRDGCFHKLVNSLLKEIGLIPRSWDTIMDEISLYVIQVEN